MKITLSICCSSVLTVVLPCLYLSSVILVLPSATYGEYVEEEPKIRVATELPKSLTCDCTCNDDESPLSSPSSSSSSQKATELPARIAYLITVHNLRTMEDAVYLFRAIRSPYNLILIHIDTKLDNSVYPNSTLYQEIEACPCGSNVVVQSVHSAMWSTWSMNLPTFWGMETALQEDTQWTTFINLSGDTMAVYKSDVIGRLFANQLNGYNFVTSSSCETGLHPTSVYYFPDSWHKRSHYTNHPPGDPLIEFEDEDGLRKNATLTIHFGSQWMALTRDFVTYIVKSLSRENSLATRFREFLIKANRLMTDETFIPTLLMHSFNHTLPPITDNGAVTTFPSMYDLRYERMDEHAPNAFGYFPIDQRYEVPATLEETQRPWGPYFLGIYDLASIRESGAIFVRKVSQQVEPNLQKLLPVSKSEDLPRIDWPKEVKISEKIDWPAKIRQMHEHYLRKQKEEENKGKINGDKDKAHDQDEK